MTFKEKELQLQYQGFLATNFLWKGMLNEQLLNSDYTFFEKEQFALSINQKLRLGKLVEKFVINQLSAYKNIEVLLENIQIQDEKITLGELDCILLENDIPIHLEVIYKFYLYDNSVGNSEIEHWIGPNRRDSFDMKYDKLVRKQLPMLYHTKTQELLRRKNIDTEKIIQKVYFKAQLFPHLNDIDKNFPLINNDCISGFYIYSNELSQYNNCKFFVPTKHNWLIQPHSNVNWLNFEEFSKQSSVFLEEEYAPMCWMKKPNGMIFKFFVVWW